MSFSEDLAHRYATRDLQLNRLAESERRKVFRSLKALDEQLTAAVRKADITGVSETFQARRQQRLLKEITPIVRKGYASIRNDHLKSTQELARQEAEWVRAGINGMTGVDLFSTLPSAEELKAVASNALIEGAPAREWWSRQSTDTLQRYRDELQQGIIAQEPNNKLLQRVRGTKAAKFKDGVLQGVRSKAAERLVRTSVQSVANAARESVFRANKDLMRGVQSLATLDLRTSDICIARAGSSWDLDTGKALPESPRQENFPGSPPWHWRCRTVLIPVLKSYEDLIGSGGRALDKKLEGVKTGTRASLDGAVSGDIGFQDWFAKQSKARREKILGPGKVKLWEDGKLPLSKLIDQRGRPLNLGQLEAQAGEG